MTIKGGLIGVIAVSVLMYLADWGFYMGLFPTPPELKAMLGTLMFNEANMPNPAWFFLMEVCVAGLLAFACLQTPLTASQAAQRGALVAAMVVGAIDISWGMTLNVPMPMNMVLIELVYKAVLGGIGAVVLVVVAKRFS